MLRGDLTTIGKRPRGRSKERSYSRAENRSRWGGRSIFTGARR
jgi:hypothetical protein